MLWLYVLAFVNLAMIFVLSTVVSPHLGLLDGENLMYSPRADAAFWLTDQALDRAIASLVLVLLVAMVYS